MKTSNRVTPLQYTGRAIIMFGCALLAAHVRHAMSAAPQPAMVSAWNLQVVAARGLRGAGCGAINLFSRHSSVKSELRIVNHTSHALDLRRIDYAGRPVYWAAIPAHGSWDVHSTTLQAWMLSSGSACVSRFVSTDASASIMIDPR